MSNINIRKDSIAKQDELELKTLYDRQESITIGPVHKQVLQDRRRTLVRQLTQTKFQLEKDLEEKLHDENNEHKTSEEVEDVSKRESSSSSVKSLSSDEHLKERYQQELNGIYDKYQKQLDDMYRRFQKDWMADPRHKGIFTAGLSFMKKQWNVIYKLTCNLRLVINEIICT